MEADENTKTTDFRWNLSGWRDVANDYALIADLLEQVGSTQEVISKLELVRANHLKDSENVFDGTISSLRELAKNSSFNLEKISDESTKSIVRNYLDDSKKDSWPSMSTDRWSRQALRCKAVAVGLRLYKLRMPEGAFSGLRDLKEKDFPLDDNAAVTGQIPKESEMKLVQLNALWNSTNLLTSNPPPLRTLADQAIEDSLDDRGSVELMIRTDIGKIIDSIVRKHFPQYPKVKPNIHWAVRHSTATIMLQVLDNKPPQAERHPTLRFDGIFEKGLEYVFKKNGSLQDWFIEYFTSEFDKRCRLIKHFQENGPYFKDPETKIESVAYLPLLDSFRLWTETHGKLAIRSYTVIQDKTIPVDLRNEVANCLARGFQRLIALADTPSKEFEETEEAVKDGSLMLLYAAMNPLGRKIFFKFQGPGKTPDDKDELLQVLLTEFMEAVLGYESKKSGGNFLGYLKKIWEPKVLTKLREKKIDAESIVLDENEEVPGDTDLPRDAELFVMKKKLSEAIKELSPTERTAIQKRYFAEERLTETEQKARYRGIQNLKKKHPELRDFLE